MPTPPADSSDGDEMLIDTDGANEIADRIVNRRRWRKYLEARQSLSAEIYELRNPPGYDDLDQRDQRDLLDAYLQETVFHTKVWVNYDAVCQMFYVDQRSAACGKINLTRPQRAHLDSDPICAFPMEKVIFTFGTPFTQLCRVSFGVKTIEEEDESDESDESASIPQQFLEVRGTSWLVDETDHRDLAAFVRNTCHGLHGRQLGQDGMTVRFLDELAASFVQHPDAWGAFYSGKHRESYPADWHHSGMAKVKPKETPLPRYRGLLSWNRAYKTARPFNLPPKYADSRGNEE